MLKAAPLPPLSIIVQPVESPVEKSPFVNKFVVARDLLQKIKNKKKMVIKIPKK